MIDTLFWARMHILLSDCITLQYWFLRFERSNSKHIGRVHSVFCTSNFPSFQGRGGRLDIYLVQVVSIRKNEIELSNFEVDAPWIQPHSRHFNDVVLPFDRPAMPLDRVLLAEPTTSFNSPLTTASVFQWDLQLNWCHPFVSGCFFTFSENSVFN